MLFQYDAWLDCHNGAIFKKQTYKKRSSRNKTKSCQKIDNSEWIKNENESYFLIVQLVKLNGDSGWVQTALLIPSPNTIHICAKNAI